MVFWIGDNTWFCHTGSLFVVLFEGVRSATMSKKDSSSQPNIGQIMIQDGQPRGRSRLIVWLLASLSLLLLGGWLTSLGLGPWYKELNFPPFQPPAWFFTPAWILILSLLAIATAKMSDSSGTIRSSAVPFAFVLYGIQFALNAGWSLLFFSLKRPDAALWEILVLDFTLLLMIFVYARTSKLAGCLLVPYLLWLLFATAINAWIVNNNGSFS